MKRAVQLISHFYWLWLLLAAPFLVFPSPKRSFALLVIPLIWLLYLWQGRKYKIENRKYKIGNIAEDRTDSVIKPGFPVTPLNLNLLILAIMLLISLWATYSMEQSLEKISGLVLGLGVFFAVVRESRKKNGWWWSLAAFLAGGLGWAVLGFLGMEYQVRFSFLYPIIARIPILISSFPTLGTGLQHNAVGGTILWYLPMLVVLSWILRKYKIENIKYKIEGCVKGKKWSGIAAWGIRFIVWLGSLFVGLVLMLTQSRGSYLAIALTAFIVIVIVLPKKWRWVLVGLLIISVIGGNVLIETSGGWESMIADIGFSGESGLSADTLSARMEIWSRVIYGIQDFPITGLGMNTFREVVHVLYPLFTISPDFDIAHAHNEFLQAALDLGIPGLLAFISIYFIAFWMLVKVWKSSFEMTNEGNGLSNFNDPLLKKTLVLGLGGGLFAHLIFGMMDAITLGAKPGIIFWMLLGLITGLYERITNIRYKIEN